MYIRIGYDLQFELTSSTHMVLMLHTHPDRAHLLQRPECLHVEPETRLDTFVDTFGNRSARIMAPAGRLRLWYDNVVYDTGDAFDWDVSPGRWTDHACAVAGRTLTRQEWTEFLPRRPYRPACGSG